MTTPQGPPPSWRPPAYPPPPGSVPSLAPATPAPSSRRGLVGAIVAAVAVVAVILVVGTLVAGRWFTGFTDPQDLRAGDCITATGLADPASDTVSRIRTVSCTDAHDGEVLVTATLSGAQARAFETDPDLRICRDALVSSGRVEMMTIGMTATALAPPDVRAGDLVACVGYHSDGTRLTAPLGR
jgi:hypothetical protein